MDEKKHSSQPQTGSESQKANENPQSGQAPIKSRRIFAKRWLYPAIYLGAAALIIGLMYIKSQTGTSPTSTNVSGEPSGQPASAAAETFNWPVAQGAKPTVSLGYFPVKGTAQEQADALVNYDNGYYPHKGIDIKVTGDKSFGVAAATAGKVTAVTQNPLMGLTIEVTSPNGYVERYESLSAATVKVGQEVSAGQAIGTSGTCQFEQSQGNHLYFEVLKNNQSVDPTTLLPKL